RDTHDELAPLVIEKRTLSRTVIEEELIPEASSLPPRQLQLAGGSKFNRWWFVAAGVLLVVGLTSFLVWRARARGTAAAHKSINSLAVLPFKPLNDATRSDDEYLGLGLSDSLITRLSNVKHLTIRPTGAIIRFNNPKQDVIAAGKQLQVESVLDGRIQHEGDRVRVTVQLFRVSDGATLWAESFDERFTDLLAVQDRISRHVAEVVSEKLTNEDQQQIAKRGTDNAEAFHAYLKGRYAWNKRTDEELKKAITLFQRAIDLDPTYAAAYAGMAYCYVSLGDYNAAPAKEVFPLAKASAMKALEIDDQLAEAHTALAHTRFLFDWDWPNAEKEYQHALELQPNNATAHHWYGWFLIAMGRTDEAMREIKRAEELDPLSLIIKANVGNFYYFARQYDQAIEIQQKVVDTDPSFVQGRRKLAFSLEAKGLEQEAIKQWLNVEANFGATPEMLASYSKAFAREGLKGYWRAALQTDIESWKNSEATAAAVASYYARLGDRDQAFLWLNKSYEAHDPWLVYTSISPVYDNLRGDPRFPTFLKQLHLEN
ncbi:MAG TPA: tetratricopeptide repeat protein, partial [Pyrinomonadaceae bacterium]|nr:tetratricopeptide repeat protein [Pyrinomonadaceae bacterium]